MPSVDKPKIYIIGGTAQEAVWDEKYPYMAYEIRHCECQPATEGTNTFKNKFNWNWLVEKDKIGMFLSEWVRKLDGPGVALCNIYNSILKYGSAGKSAFLRHADNSKDHNARVSATKNNTTVIRPAVAIKLFEITIILGDVVAMRQTHFIAKVKWLRENENR